MYLLSQVYRQYRVVLLLLLLLLYTPSHRGTVQQLLSPNSQPAVAVAATQAQHAKRPMAGINLTYKRLYTANIINAELSIIYYSGSSSRIDDNTLCHSFHSRKSLASTRNKLYPYPYPAAATHIMYKSLYYVLKLNHTRR